MLISVFDIIVSLRSNCSNFVVNPLLRYQSMLIPHFAHTAHTCTCMHMHLLNVHALVGIRLTTTWLMPSLGVSTLAVQSLTAAVGNISFSRMKGTMSCMLFNPYNNSNAKCSGESISPYCDTIDDTTTGCTLDHEYLSRCNLQSNANPPAQFQVSYTALRL